MATNQLGFEHLYIKPASANVDSPTLLLLHGTGGDQHDLVPLGEKIDPNAVLLSPLGKVREGSMPRFFRRLAEGIFDEADIKFRAAELADFVSQAAQTYDFDPTKVTAVGFSNGANIAAATMLLRPGVFRSAILLHAMVPLVPETYPELSGVRVFLGAGETDPIAPPRETQSLAGLMRGCNASVEVYYHAGGHQLTADEIRAAKGWYERVE